MGNDSSEQNDQNAWLWLVQRTATRDPKGISSVEQRSPGELVDHQEQLSQSRGVVHHDLQEAKQVWQEARLIVLLSSTTGKSPMEGRCGDMLPGRNT